jgi:hypothetical protein
MQAQVPFDIPEIRLHEGEARILRGIGQSIAVLIKTE